MGALGGKPKDRSRERFKQRHSHPITGQPLRGPTIQPTIPPPEAKSKIVPPATLIEQITRAPWSQVGVPVALTDNGYRSARPNDENLLIFKGGNDGTNFRDLNAALAARSLEGRMTVIFADEVIQSLDTKEECRKVMSETPCVRMPFETIWIEAAQAKSISGPIAGLSNDFTRMAVCAIKQQGPTRTFVESGIPLEEWAESVVLTTYVRRMNGDLVGPITWSEFSVRENGYVFKHNDAPPERQIAAHHWDDLPLGMMYVLQSPGKEYDSVEFLLADCAALGTALALRTIGLMNCSNVRYVEGGVINEDVSKKKRQRDRLPLIKYHVLKLVSGTKLIPLQVARRTGEGVALHMVRGHFRDYSKKGLFGRYHYNAVWVPPHARGSAEHGTRINDYSVSPSQEEGASAC